MSTESETPQPQPPPREKFPAHGWTQDSNGYTVLWLPVIRMVVCTEREGPDLKQSHHYNAQAFVSTVDKLVISLGRLAHHLEEAPRAHKSFDEMTVEETEHHMHHSDLAPLFVDLTYTYLRRIAHLFTKSVRPILFTHTDSVPQKLSGLRDLDTYEELAPRCDTEKLTQALRDHTGWLDRIRDSQSGGIRDILEHHLVSASLKDSAYKSPEGEWIPQTEVIMDYPGQNREPPYSEDLIGPIRDITDDLCSMWTEMCEAVDWKSHDNYTGVRLASPNSLIAGKVGDGVLVDGSSEGTTEFWPEMRLE
jgi:hypothetical protein